MQEIVLAPNVHIVSGSYSFLWEILQKAICAYVIDDPYDNSLETVTQLVNLRRSFGKGHEMKLLDALNRTILLKATDLKDKIFGLLSLTCDGPTIIPSPDYNSTIHSIVGAVMRGIAASEMTLDVLAAKMPWEAPTNSPSWYPYWTYLWNTPARAQERYHTCQKAMDIRATRRSKFLFEVTGHTVLTYGIELDMINGTGLIIPRTNFAHPNSQCDSATTRYQSAEKIFMNIDSLLFITEDNSPDRWMFLAALFTFHEDDMEFLGILVGNLVFAAWIITYGNFLVNGRPLTDWASSLQHSSEGNHSITQKGLPELEGPRWNEYLSKLIRWHQRAYAKLTVTQSGRLGMVHVKTEHGDKICLLNAFRNIVILRPWLGIGYKIVGYALLEGMMYGEMDHILAGDNLQCFRIH